MFKDAIPGTPQPRRVTRPMDFIVWFLVLLFVLTVAGRSNAQNSAPQCVTPQAWEGIVSRIMGARS